MSPAAIDQVLTVAKSSTGLRRISDAHPGQSAELAVRRSQQVRVVATAPATGWPWKRFAIPAAVILAAVAGVGIAQPRKLLHSESAVSPVSHLVAVQAVNVAQPSPASTAKVELPATIRPWQVTMLHSRVTGYLSAWHVDLGSRVKTGDVLAELETPELDQEVAEGESQAREAAAAAVQARAERSEAEAAFNVAVAQLARAKAEAELSESQLRRSERLLATRAVSADENDTFQKQWKARTADTTAAEADVSRRQTSLATHDAIIEAREATAKSRQANVERLRELQSFKRIVAPFDGIVTRRTAEVGMLITAGTDSLFVIQDMSRVRVQVNVPQANSALTKVGSEAIVSVPESGAQAVRGTITRIADSIDSTNRTMLAEIELDNATHGFQPGSYAKVTLTTPQSNTAWTIPANTLQMRVDGPHVAVVGEDNHVEMKAVTLGRNLGNRVVVIDGIRGQERLIVNPSDALTSGTVVEVNSQKMAQR
jgi:multidrug efflux pump subunit AcrA (membrane-fusion protein)